MLRTKKILRDSVREYRGISLRAPVYVTLESIMECVIPFLMAMLIDYGIDGNNGAGDMGYIWKMGLILIGCTVITLLFGALAGKTAAEASAGYAKNLRHDLYYHVQDFSFSNIERFSTASLVTRMTTDVTNVQMAFQMRKRILFRAPVMLVFSLVMSFLINPELAIIFLCVTPFLVVGLFFIMRHAHPIFERVFKTYDKLNQVVQENLRASPPAARLALQWDRRQEAGRSSGMLLTAGFRRGVLPPAAGRFAVFLRSGPAAPEDRKRSRCCGRPGSGSNLFRLQSNRAPYRFCRCREAL